MKIRTNEIIRANYICYKRIKGMGDSTSKVYCIGCILNKVEQYTICSSCSCYGKKCDIVDNGLHIFKIYKEPQKYKSLLQASNDLVIKCKKICSDLMK